MSPLTLPPPTDEFDFYSWNDPEQLLPPVAVEVIVLVNGDSTRWLAVDERLRLDPDATEPECGDSWTQNEGRVLRWCHAPVLPEGV